MCLVLVNTLIAWDYGLPRHGSQHSHQRLRAAGQEWGLLSWWLLCPLQSTSRQRELSEPSLRGRACHHLSSLFIPGTNSCWYHFLKISQVVVCPVCHLYYCQLSPHQSHCTGCSLCLWPLPTDTQVCWPFTFFMSLPT